jgi:hypothetical protein
MVDTMRVCLYDGVVRECLDDREMMRVCVFWIGDDDSGLTVRVLT